MPNRSDINSGAAVLLLAALSCAADDRFLRPVDRTVLPPGPLSVVARTTTNAELHLDGKPVPSSQPAANVLTATVNATPGRHELSLGSQKIQIFIRAQNNAASAPEGWGEFKPHPPAATCDTCHAVNAGAWSFKPGNLADTCSGCHDAKKFPATHTHNSEVLEECQMCHSPHGSTVKGHLKVKRELACKQCHG